MFKSWLGLLNFFVLQWLLFRLQETVDVDDGKHLSWDVIGPIVPLTGWWSSYVRVW